MPQSKIIEQIFLNPSLTADEGGVDHFSLTLFPSTTPIQKVHERCLRICAIVNETMQYPGTSALPYPVATGDLQLSSTYAVITGDEAGIRTALDVLYDKDILTHSQRQIVTKALDVRKSGRIEGKVKEIDFKEFQHKVDKLYNESDINTELFRARWDINPLTPEGLNLHVLHQAQQHGLFQRRNGRFEINLTRENFENFHDFVRTIPSEISMEQAYETLRNALTNIAGIQAARGIRSTTSTNAEGGIAGFSISFDEQSARAMNQNFHRLVREQERASRGLSPDATPNSTGEDRGRPR